MNAMPYNKLNQYKAVNSAGMAAQVESANPHLLISMLMKSALERMLNTELDVHLGRSSGHLPVHPVRHCNPFLRFIVMAEILSTC